MSRIDFKLAVVGVLLVAAGCSDKATKATSPTAGSTLSPRGPVAIKDVAFTGGTAAPVVAINGSGFGVSPTPNPPYSPEGHAPCTLAPKGSQGLDYGMQLYLANGRGNWGAGRYKAAGNLLDCVGINVTSFTPGQIVFHLGSAYADHPDAYRLKEGDSFSVGVKGVTYEEKVHYSK